MAAQKKEDLFWTEFKTIYKNCVSNAQNEKNITSFHILVGPFIFSKPFPRSKYISWAVKSGLMQKNSHQAKSTMPLELMDYIIEVASKFIFVLELLGPGALDKKENLIDVKSLEAASAIVEKSSFYSHLRCMCTKKNQSDKFCTLVTIFIGICSEFVEPFIYEDVEQVANFMHIFESAMELQVELGLGERDLSEEKYQSAITHFTSLLKQHPVAWQVHYNLSVAFLGENSLHDALKEARLAVILNPISAVTLCQLSKVIDKLGSPNQAFDVAQEGLQLFYGLNVDKKEIKILEEQKLQLLPRVEINLWNIDKLSAFTSSPDMLSMAEDEFLQKNPDLIAKYSSELEKFAQNESKKNEAEVNNTRLCLAYLLSQSGNAEDHEKSLTLCSFLILSSLPEIQYSSYFIMASILKNMLRYKECRIAAETGDEIVSQVGSEINIKWAHDEHNVTMEKFRTSVIKAGLQSILHFCDNLHEPIATCRYDYENDKHKKHEHTVNEIYEHEPNYKGFFQVTCTEKCILQYHLQCWKYLKEDSVISSEKDFLGTMCLTPDCNGAVQTIQIFKKEQVHPKILSLPKEEALNKLEHMNNEKIEEVTKERKTRKRNLSLPPESHHEARAPKDMLTLELLSKVESLSQKVHELTMYNKENKKEMGSQKDFFDKLKNENLKFNEERKSFKSEWKIWKAERTDMKQEIQNLHAVVKVLSSKLESQELEVKCLESALQQGKEKCDEVASKAKLCQISFLEEKLEVGDWMVSWAIHLAARKASSLLQKEATRDEKQIIHSLSNVKDLSDKREMFVRSIKKQIDTVAKDENHIENENIPIPVTVRMLDALFENYLSAHDASNIDHNQSSRADRWHTSTPSAFKQCDSFKATSSNAPAIAEDQQISSHQSYFIKSARDAERFRSNSSDHLKSFNNSTSQESLFAIQNLIPHSSTSKDVFHEQENGVIPFSPPQKKEPAYSNIVQKNEDRSVGCDYSMINNSTNSNLPSRFEENVELNNHLENSKDFGRQKSSDDKQYVLRDPAQHEGDILVLGDSKQRQLNSRNSPSYSKMSLDNFDSFNDESLLAKSSGVIGKAPPTTHIHPDQHDIIGSSGNENRISPLTLDFQVVKSKHDKHKFPLEKSGKEVKSQKKSSQVQPSMWSPKHMSTHQKLLLFLQKDFPNYSAEVLNYYISEVRKENKNTLTGLPIDNIKRRVGAALQRASSLSDKFNSVQKTSGTQSNPPKLENTIKNLEKPKPAMPAPWSNVHKKKWEPDIQDQPECTICQEQHQSSDSMTLDCGHIFHKRCIDKWLKQKKTCPICRVHFPPEEDFPSLA